MNRPWLGAAGVFALALLVYSLSLAPGVFSWDSAELTLGIYTQGIVHATGYPLYLMLGRLFTLLPVSADFAVRANLFSAACGALTVALLYLICLHLTQRPLIALTSAALYGLAREIWAQAVVAEVYTLHTALAAGALLAVIRRAEAGTRRVYLAAFLFGLALANHLSALLVAVIALPYLLWKESWRTRLIALLITGGTAGLLYLYLPLRFAANPDFNLVGQYFERDLTQPGDLMWMVSGRMFGREMFAYPLAEWAGEIVHFVGELSLNFLGVGALMGAIGVYSLWRERRELCLLLLGIFGAQALFFSSYDVFDKWTMFHTAYLAWAVFVAAGSHFLLRQLSPAPVYLFLGALVAAQLIANWNAAGRAGDTFVAERSEQLLTALPHEATLIGPWTALRPLEYAQIVGGERRDVRLVDVTLLTLGERDRLNEDRAAPLKAAVDERLRQQVACAPADVYVIDPAALDTTAYEVAFVQTGLYQVTRHPAGAC